MRDACHLPQFRLIGPVLIVATCHPLKLVHGEKEKNSSHTQKTNSVVGLKTRGEGWQEQVANVAAALSNVIR